MTEGTNVSSTGHSNIGLVNTGESNVENIIISNKHYENVIYQYLAKPYETLEERKEKYLSNLRLPNLIEPFEGRISELETLEDKFFKKKLRKVVISGPSGLGKTSLAIKFARYCKEQGKIDDIVWIDFENYCDPQKIFDLKIVYKKFKKNKLLFIFDGVSKRRDILEYEKEINSKDNYFLLLTSCESNWEKDIYRFLLPPLMPESAEKIFEKIIGRSYNTEDMPLYKEVLDCIKFKLPLELHVIAKYISYLLTIELQDLDLQNEIRKLQNQQSFDVAIKGLLDKMITIKDKNSLAISLNALIGCTFLNSNCINLNTLVSILKPNNFLTDSNENISKLESLIKDLSLLNCTITKQFNNINIHNCIQEKLLCHLRNQELEILNKCYTNCLKFITDNIDKAFAHIPSILKHADTNLDTFYDFYIQNKISSLAHAYPIKKLINVNFKKKYEIPIVHYTGLRIILENLIATGCIESLKKLFTSFGNDTREYINSFELLHCSVYHDQIKILNLLLSHEVDIGKKNEIGDTALHIASFRWNLEAIRILKKYGASIDIVNYNKQKPLQKYFEGGWYDAYFVNEDNHKAIIDALNTTLEIH